MKQKTAEQVKQEMPLGWYNIANYMVYEGLDFAQAGLKAGYKEKYFLYQEFWD